MKYILVALARGVHGATIIEITRDAYVVPVTDDYFDTHDMVDAADYARNAGSNHATVIPLIEQIEWEDDYPLQIHPDDARILRKYDGP